MTVYSASDSKLIIVVVIVADGDAVVVVDNDSFSHATTKKITWMRKEGELL